MMTFKVCGQCNLGEDILAVVIANCDWKVLNTVEGKATQPLIYYGHCLDDGAGFLQQLNG